MPSTGKIFSVTGERIDGLNNFFQSTGEKMMFAEAPLQSIL